MDENTAREWDIPNLPKEKETVMPLVRVPPEASFTEKIGKTEYTVTARFREQGDDLLCLLNRFLQHGVGAETEEEEYFEESL